VTPADEDRLTDYSEDGVDLTLIRCMLAFTPAERLQVLEEYVDDILSIRKLNAGKG
jgi:hypothetical protein